MSTEKVVDRRREALDYMNEHKINILFDFLGAKLARDKPQNPNEYLVQELQNILEHHSAGQSV